MWNESFGINFHYSLNCFFFSGLLCSFSGLHHTDTNPVWDREFGLTLVLCLSHSGHVLCRFELPKPNSTNMPKTCKYFLNHKSMSCSPLTGSIRSQMSLRSNSAPTCCFPNKTAGCWRHATAACICTQETLPNINEPDAHGVVPQHILRNKSWLMTERVHGDYQMPSWWHVLAYIHVFFRGVLLFWWSSSKQWLMKEQIQIISIINMDPGSSFGYPPTPSIIDSLSPAWHELMTDSLQIYNLFPSS